MCVDRRRMNFGPSHFWWRDRHTRAEKLWRCSRACILKCKLDWHHEIRLKIKFRPWLRDLCEQNFQNIVTWGVKLQSHNIGFACFSLESWISGVPPSIHSKKHTISLFKWVFESESTFDQIKSKYVVPFHWLASHKAGGQLSLIWPHPYHSYLW